MTTAHVNADASLMKVATKGYMDTKSSAKTSGFKDVMNDSMKDQEKDVTPPVKKEDNIKPDNKVDTKEEVKEDVVDKTNNSDSTDVEETTSSTDKSLEEKISDKINEMVEDVKETIKDNLNITDEQLESIMSMLGLVKTDLLDLESVQKIALEVFGVSDMSSVLTNEDMTKNMMELMKFMKELNPKGTLETEFNLENVSKEEMDLILEQVKDTKVDKLSENLKDVQGKVNPINENKTNVLNLKDGENVLENSEKSVEIIKDTTVTNESSMFDNKNQQKGNETTETKAFNEVFNNLAQTVSNTTESFDGQLVQVKEVRNIINQIVSQIKVIIKPDMTTMEFQLNPENLGKVHLSVSAKEGVMTAQFLVQNEMAKEAIGSQIQVLKDSLIEQGLKVDAVEVSVSDFAFNQSNQAETGQKEQSNNNAHTTKKQINLDDINFLEEDLTSEEEIAIDIMKQNGNSVDYTA